MPGRAQVGGRLEGGQLAVRPQQRDAGPTLGTAMPEPGFPGLIYSTLDASSPLPAPPPRHLPHSGPPNSMLGSSSPLHPGPPSSLCPRVLSPLSLGAPQTLHPRVPLPPPSRDLQSSGHTVPKHPFPPRPGQRGLEPVFWKGTGHLCLVKPSTWELQAWSSHLLPGDMALTGARGTPQASFHRGAFF